MKKKLNRAILFAFAIQSITFSALAQQTFSYTQYMNNLTPVNASYSLLDKATSINALGRKQWVGIQDAPSTFMLNASMPLTSINGSAGLIVMNDTYGLEKVTEVNAFIAKAVRLSENSFFSASVNAGIRNFKATYSALDASDPQFQNSDINETRPNVGLGLMVYSNKYYFGISAPRLNINKVDRETRFYKNTYYVAAGYLQQLGKDFKVKPSALLAYAGSNIPAQLDLSTLFYIKDMYGLGVNYRTNNELAGIASFMVNSNLQIGYSYQFGFGSDRIGSLSNATHEIVLGYRFGKGLVPKFL